MAAWRRENAGVMISTILIWRKQLRLEKYITGCINNGYFRKPAMKINEAARRKSDNEKRYELHLGYRTTHVRIISSMCINNIANHASAYGALTRIVVRHSIWRIANSYERHLSMRVNKCQANMLAP